MDALIGGPGLFAILAIVFVLLVLIYFVPVGLYISALSSGVRLSLFGDLVGMRLRKVPPAAIVNPLITAHKAGIPVTAPQLERTTSPAATSQKVVRALISADKANIPLTFEQATAIDLAGRDVFEAVQVSVNPRSSRRRRSRPSPRTASRCAPSRGDAARQHRAPRRRGRRGDHHRARR